MSKDIRGPWLELQSGKKWFILDPDPELVDINDISAALSKICRFGGHTRRFYSVAQHCVLGAEEIRKGWGDPRKALHFLLHDASEAYLVDLPTPIKSLMPTYVDLEDLTQRVIAGAFGLEYPWPAYVKEVDNRMLITEQRDLMSEGPLYVNAVPFPDIDLTYDTWDPEHAERLWLRAFNMLKGD